MKHSYSNDDTCFSIDVIDEILEEDFDALLNIVEYGVSTSTGYSVSSNLSNTTYSSQQINTAYLLPLDIAYFSVRMTKVIKREFEKIKDIKVEDDSLACDSPLEVFNYEVSRLSKMDDNLFTYEVEIANIPCDLRVDDELEHEADDMGFDPSDIAFIECSLMKNFLIMKMKLLKFRINTNIFDYETPICSAFNEFNYLLKVDPDLLTKDIMGFKTYDDYKANWIYEWNKDVPWVYEKPCTDTGLWTELKPYEALEDSELKDEALRNKAIMEGFIKDNDDESSYEQMRRWVIYTNYDDTYKTNHDDNEREELCEVHERPVCTIQRFEMIKYSFGQGEEYVDIKEDEYDDLERKSNNACRMYQEIFL
ncbi:hypothetical protein Tco_0824276 [Tanacetum coccineum]|uniref:Uncharacterized protein n=1 Tax=Tanacetum coccineum TaxID=301880 RepID=A0ABQ5AMZ0_9ASTR